MIRGAMKRCGQDDRVLLRCNNARQFGLKLIANVTYGYTAANYSGRMPFAELADAIVSLARAGRNVGGNHRVGRGQREMAGKSGVRRYRLAVCAAAWAYTS